MTAAAFSCDDVVAEAREWIGTAYRHGHATKGAGCDCLGLIRGVHAALTGRMVPVPAYSPSWRSTGPEDVLLRNLSMHLVPVDAPQPGDVLAFRMVTRGRARHCGILATPGTLLHTYAGIGSVQEVALGEWWRSRIAATYRFAGVE